MGKAKPAAVAEAEVLPPATSYEDFSRQMAEVLCSPHPNGARSKSVRNLAYSCLMNASARGDAQGMAKLMHTMASLGWLDEMTTAKAKAVGKGLGASGMRLVFLSAGESKDDWVRKHTDEQGNLNVPMTVSMLGNGNGNGNGPHA